MGFASLGPRYFFAHRDKTSAMLAATTVLSWVLWESPIKIGGAATFQKILQSCITIGVRTIFVPLFGFSLMDYPSGICKLRSQVLFRAPWQNIGNACGNHRFKLSALGKSYQNWGRGYISKDTTIMHHNRSQNDFCAPFWFQSYGLSHPCEKCLL